jgi:lactoylglutathione lyase
MEQNTLILQLRVALTTTDYQRMMNFYQDALGLEPAELWTTETSHGSLFWMGKASLEIFDEEHAAVVDEIEVGRRMAGTIRFALQVPDVYAAIERVAAKGAKVIHPPKLTPWGDLNARIEDPDGMQVTLFQSTGSSQEQE